MVVRAANVLARRRGRRGDGVNATRAPAPAPGVLKVSAIIVAYRSAEVLADCLRSLEHLARVAWLEVIVVDNASPDDSAGLVEHSFPWVTLLRLPSNLGFAGGVNRGLRVAQGAYFALVNPDAVVPPGTLEGLLGYLEEHPEVGLVGPRIVRPSGRVECTASYRPTFHHEVINALGLFVLRRWVPAWRSNVLLDLPAAPVAVDVVTGCFMVFPRRVLEVVGEFDEQFFMYVEDVDWCVRVRQAGFEVHYVPTWSVLHERSHGGANASLTLMDGAGNVELYFRKHGVPHFPLALRWLRRLHYVSRTLWLLYRAAGGQSGASTEARRAWLTLVESFRNRPGRSAS